MAFVEQLEEDQNDLASSLLELVDKQDAVRLVADRFSQDPSTLVSDVCGRQKGPLWLRTAWGTTDEAADRVSL